jgi:hypothetical protein
LFEFASQKLNVAPSALMLEQLDAALIGGPRDGTEVCVRADPTGKGKFRPPDKLLPIRKDSP